MPKVTIPIAGVDRDYLAQLDYALAFASEDIVSYALDRDALTIEAEVRSEEQAAAVTEKVNELVARYARREFGLPSVVHFEQKRDLPTIDAWTELRERGWVTEVGHR